MLSKIHSIAIALILVMLTSPVFAQQPKSPGLPPPAPVKKVNLPPPPPRTAVAAMVNGKPIPEIAVYRAMVRIPTKFWAKARPEILGFLIENALVDQYLELIKVSVAAKSVAEKLKQIRDELKKNKQELADFLKRFHLTEAELRQQITGAVRWDKFLEKYASEKQLKEMFSKNKEMFDGSMVRARHLLIKPKEKTPAGRKAAQAKVVQLRQKIEAQVKIELGKVAAGSDKLTIVTARREALKKAFSEIAKANSHCPSAKSGGDVSWFPRLGKMVEPFSNAAFATPTFQITQPVETEFGFHLILPTDRKEGRKVEFEQVKSFVKEVYSERLREAILKQMRPRAKIQTNKAK